MLLWLLLPCRQHIFKTTQTKQLEAEGYSLSCDPGRGFCSALPDFKPSVLQLINIVREELYWQFKVIPAEAQARHLQTCQDLCFWQECSTEGTSVLMSRWDSSGLTSLFEHMCGITCKHAFSMYCGPKSPKDVPFSGMYKAMPRRQRLPRD
jgi:hypothetical protein